MTKREENLQNLNTTSKPVFKIKITKKEMQDENIHVGGNWTPLYEYMLRKKLEKNLNNTISMQILWGGTKT